MPKALTRPPAETFEAELSTGAPTKLRIASLLGTIAFATMWFVDPYLAAADDLPAAQAVRVGACVLLVGVFAVSFWPKVAERHERPLSFVALAVTGLAVILLAHLTGGVRSEYHEALYLTMFGYSVLPWAWRRLDAGIAYAAIVATYVVVMVSGGRGAPFTSLGAHTVQLSLGALIAAVTHRFAIAAHKRDYEARVELARANAQLTRLDEAKSNFFANLSHELRTPLTLTLAPLEAVLQSSREPIEGGAREKLQLAYRNALRLLRLVDDLLALTRAEATSLRLRATPVDVPALLKTLTVEIAGLAARKNLSLALDVAADVPVVTADAALLERVLLNLVGNAMRFVREGGAIVLGARAAGDGVEVNVTDNGIGIGAADLPHIFDRFYQVDTGPTRAFGGTGIGLALAREIVDLHGGWIRAESEPGVGTTMRFWLPSHPPADRPMETATAPAPREAGGLSEWHDAIRHAPDYRYQGIADATERRIAPRTAPAGPAPTVLVVEDNADMIRFIVALLAHDFNVLTAQNGAIGLRLATERRPDLIVSDVMMPELDGFTMGRRLRENPATATIPLVYLSARGETEDRLAARDGGAVSYLTKPFRADELLATVDTLLARDRKVREAAVARQDEALVFFASGVVEGLGRSVRALRAAADALPERAAAEVEAVAAMADELAAFCQAGTDPVELPARVLDVVTAVAAGHPSVRVQVPPDVRVALPPAELRLVLEPLVARAIAVTPPELTVHVRAQRTEGGRVTLTVEDAGPELSREMAARVFFPYFESGSGTAGGLALARALRVVQARRGSVDVGTADGQGTRVLVSLPIVGELVS